MTPTSSVAAHRALNRPLVVRTIACEVRSPVIVGMPASTLTLSDRHVDQFPAASVARTAIVHVPVVSVSTWLRVVTARGTDHGPEPLRCRTW